MRINYFDLGLYHGTELTVMAERIIPEIGFDNFFAYGFEACREHYEAVSNIPWLKKDNIKIFNYAVSGKPGNRKLYHAPNNLGHSLFSTKKNVTSESEDVESILFSEWILDNVPTFKDDINIIKMNIEGAEYEVFQDLVKSDLVKHVDIFCGAGHDIEKISELLPVKGDYYALLENNDIFLHKFSATGRFDSTPEGTTYTIIGHDKNVNMLDLVLSAIDNRINGELNV